MPVYDFTRYLDGRTVMLDYITVHAADDREAYAMAKEHLKGLTDGDRISLTVQSVHKCAPDCEICYPKPRASKGGVTKRALDLLLAIDTTAPSPFMRRDGQLYLRFDSIRITPLGPGLAPEVTCYWGSIHVYTFTLSSTLMGSFITLTGFTSEVKMSFAEGD